MDKAVDKCCINCGGIGGRRYWTMTGRTDAGKIASETLLIRITPTKVRVTPISIAATIRAAINTLLSTI